MATMKVVKQKQPGVTIMSWSDGLRIFIIGAVVGLAAMALFVLLDKYIFTPTLCSDNVRIVGRCADKLAFSNIVAMILAAFGALIALVQTRVFRPLLVVLVATTGLWSVLPLSVTLPWWGGVLMTAIIFGLGYLLFAWIVQIRNFVTALIISVVLVIIVRLMLV